MLGVNVCTPKQWPPQAGTGCPRAVVTITESRPNEADEPRHLIRRAIYAIRVGKNYKSKHRSTALKVVALMVRASQRARAIGSWSSSHTYDPLPDFINLRDAAVARMGPPRVGNNPVALMLETLDLIVREFHHTTADQRMGRA